MTAGRYVSLALADIQYVYPLTAFYYYFICYYYINYTSFLTFPFVPNFFLR